MTVAKRSRPVRRLSGTPGLDEKVARALRQLEDAVEDLEQRLQDAEDRLEAGGL
jgi:hypothetical protein